MHRDGKDLTRLGMVPDLVEAGEIAAPVARRDASPGIDIEGKETSKVNVSIGLSVLGSFIGALGGGNLGVTAAFSKARTVTFKYAGVLEDRIAVLDLEKYVRAGSIDPSVPPGTIDKLIDDEIYVTTAVLKTKKLVVSAQGDAGQSIGVDVPVIQGAVGGSVKVETGGTLAQAVSFEGAVPIVFGLQAVQLVFDETGQFLTTQQLEPGVAAPSPRRRSRAGPRPPRRRARAAGWSGTGRSRRTPAGPLGARRRSARCLRTTRPAPATRRSRP